MHSEHPDELLAWYVNGTLKQQQRQDVEQHLQTCARCQREVSLLQKIREQIKADQPHAPGDFGLSRLMRDIHRPPSAARQRRWWQPALAAAAVVIVVQGIVLMNLFYQPAPIVPLGESSREQVVLQIKFSPQATEQQIRELLQKIHGALIDGPGVLGVYRVRLEGAASARDETVSKIISELRAQENIVTHVARE